jgi:anaerobic selenocysteine-containing dehydrogenase
MIGGPAGRLHVEPIDPIALPGVESVERQGAPPRVGTATADQPGVSHAAPGQAVPAVISEVPALADLGAAPHIPQADSYSLRLVAQRRLYDAGSSVTGSPSLTPLVPPLVARANPYDLDRLGAKTGDRVRVRSARGALTLPAQADHEVPRGVVAVDFNVPLAESADTPANAVSTIIDSRQSVTDVRLESV